jgi:predicted SAM-dependent methyltransferase
MKPREWWLDKFHKADPDYEVEIVDKEDLEKGNVIECIPKSRYPGIKLNLGSYLDQFHYDWVNIDILPLHRASLGLGTKFRQYDVTHKIREKDNSVDCIVASHILEHLTRDQGIALIKEAYRVLKPGGTFRIATPDLRKIATKYLNGSIKDFAVFSKIIRDAPDDAFSFWEAAMSGHKTVYDEIALLRIMIDAGFDKAKTTPFNLSDSEIIRNETFDLHPEVSVYVEGVKP